MDPKKKVKMSWSGRNNMNWMFCECVGSMQRISINRTKEVPVLKCVDCGVEVSVDDDRMYTSKLSTGKEEGDE